MYKLKYYSDFKDRSNNALRLEIYIDTTATVTASEIKLLSDAMTIEYSAENLFEPLKTSRASISILTEDLLTDLYSGGLFGTAVKLLKNNSLFWTGYATPCIYSQSYVGKWDTLTLECVDSVSQLQNIDYTNAINDSSGIASFFDVISHCLTQVDPLHAVTQMYVDNSITLGSNQPIFDALFIKERNFYDEKNEPEKLDEVVKAILRYLGLTLIQFKNRYYIINQEKTQQQSFTMRRYLFNNGSWQTDATSTMSISKLSLAEIGLAADDTQLSLDGVFNKVTVIANNNPLSSILPDFEDTDDLVNQSSNPNQEYTESYTGVDGTTYTLVSAFLKSANNWNYGIPRKDFAGATPVSEVTLSNRDSLVGGVFWQKCFSFEAGYEPPTRDWQTYITMVGDEWCTNVSPLLSLNHPQSMILDGGYLIINLKYKLSTEKKAHSIVASRYDSFNTFGYCTDLMWNDSTGNIGAGQWPCDTMFVAKLSIGDWCYNGEDWISISEYRQKQAHWNTLYSGYGIDMSGGEKYWYAIPDSQFADELEYVPKSVYDASNSAFKQKGLCPTAHATKFYHNIYNEWIYVSKDFRTKMLYGDRFFLVHQNKTTEKIYDTEYSLTNSVSYLMNIVDATSGAAIPCKTDMSMYGQLQFEISEPITSVGGLILGHNPQYRSDNASTTCRAIHISDLSIAYKKSTEYKDIFSSAKVDPDTIYTNVVNGSYCKELDDVTLKVNTANDWATSYSYAIAQRGNDYNYIKGVQFDGTDKKPEERIVERLVNHYKTPKYKLTSTVHNGNTDVMPFQPIREPINGVTKQMVVNNANYNVSADTVTIEANEI